VVDQDHVILAGKCQYSSGSRIQSRYCPVPDCRFYSTA